MTEPARRSRHDGARQDRRTGQPGSWDPLPLRSRTLCKSSRLRHVGGEQRVRVGATSVLGRVANAVAGLLPEPVLAGIVRRVYPRVEPELRRLAELTTGGGIVLDVGAWYGPWSYRLLRRAARTVAVEPNPRLAGVLRATLPGVEVVEAALGDRADSVQLWIPVSAGDARGSPRSPRPVSTR